MWNLSTYSIDFKVTIDKLNSQVSDHLKYVIKKNTKWIESICELNH